MSEILDDDDDSFDNEKKFFTTFILTKGGIFEDGNKISYRKCS